MTNKSYDELYIKFKEGNNKSLHRAINEAKRLGYKQRTDKGSMELKGKGILRLSDGEYFISNFTEDKVKSFCKGKEHKIPEEKETNNFMEDLVTAGVSELHFANMQIEFLLNIIDEIEVLSKLENPGKVIEKVCSIAKERHNLDKTINAKVLFKK